MHLTASAFRADADIYFPDCFYQFSYGQTCISGTETLMSLNSEDQFQVFAFAPVIQESIVTDLLKTCRKYMHQISADEFCIVQRNDPAWITRFPAACGKSPSLSSTFRIRLLEMATLCVYLPRYSIALPNPLKVSLI